MGSFVFCKTLLGLLIGLSLGQLGGEGFGTPVQLGQLDITVRSYKEVGSKRIRVYSEEQTYRVLNGVVDASLAPLV